MARALWGPHDLTTRPQSRRRSAQERFHESSIGLDTSSSSLWLALISGLAQSPDLNQLKTKLQQLEQMMQELKSQIAAAEQPQAPITQTAATQEKQPSVPTPPGSRGAHGRRHPPARRRQHEPG